MPLSDAKLRALRPCGRRYELPDRDGLNLRVGTTGANVWTVTYTVRGAGQAGGARVARFSGERQRMTIGIYPAMSLLEARMRAQEIRQTARSGVDPRPTATAEEAEAARPTTVSDLLEQYAQQHLQRNLDSGDNVERLLERHVVPHWGDRAITELTAPDLVALLERVRVPGDARVQAQGQDQHYAAMRGGPGAAVEVRKWTRAMFQFAVASGLLQANPFTKVRNRDRVRPRERYLSMEEVQAVWRAAGRLPNPWSALFRLLLLTGSRRNEWAGAKWSWMDKGVTRLEIPANDYKTGRGHVVPFSRQVQAILRGMPQGLLGPYLLSTAGGTVPVSGFSKAKAGLDALVMEEMDGVEVAPWVVHDLRRSMATHMERLGVLPHVIEACLGHALRGVAGTYRHYNHLEEKRTALQLWADTLEGVGSTAVTFAA